MSSFVNITRPVLKSRRRHQRGQSAVVALLVLLLLAFVGALFVTIIARNLETTGRTHRTLNADYYAEAGLRYADDQLTSSLDGADWRPPLQFQLSAAPADPNGLKRYNALVAANILTPVNPSDPDATYLQQGFTRYNTQNGRFLLRVTYDPVLGSTLSDPTQKYLKIESIGREGSVDPKDPTTYQNQPRTRLVSTLVAYKPIGITDYARFETNIDNRSGTANLGVPSLFHASQGASDPTTPGIVTPGVFDFNIISRPSVLTVAQYPVITTYGGPDAYMAKGNTIYANPLAGTGAYNSMGVYTPAVPAGYTPIAGGGSLRANMNLRLFGQTNVYLNRSVPAQGAFPSVLTTVEDDVEVAGNLLLDSYDPTQPLYNPYPPNTLAGPQQAALIVYQPTQNNGTVSTVATSQYPSNDPNGRFSTQLGAVRDGATGGNASDANGYPRSIARLDPPVIDNASSATNLTRYQAVTENSPPRLNPASANSSDPYSGTTYSPTLGDGNSAGLDGYGRAIYVNNVSDIQRDSATLVGGHTLVDEWLNANPGGQAPTSTKGGWVGPFYNPPGAEVVFGPQPVTVGQGANAASGFKYGFRITRSDVDANGNPVLWKDPTDSTGQATIGPILAVTYDSIYASNDPTANPASLSGDQLTSFQANPNNDVVIYLEGNVRLRGSLSANPNTPVPSGGTAPAADDTYPRHVTVITNGTAYIDGNLLKGDPDSSITVLARDYVCVNTTQFLAGAAQSYPVVSNSLLTFNEDSDQFVQEFSFGLTPGQALPNTQPGTGNNGAPASPLALYVSGGAGAGGSVIADFDLANPLVLTNQGLPEGIRSGTTPGNPFDNPILGLPSPAGTATFSGLFNSPGPSAANPAGVSHITYDLYNLGNDANGQPLYNTLLNAPPQQPFQLWIRRDPAADVNGVNVNATTYEATSPFQLERTAILPMDIRVEAVLYAQNKSFFVIPGPWFNTDSGDTIDVYKNSDQNNTGVRIRSGIPALPANGSTSGYPFNMDPDHARFPFYGQPIDMRITVVGAVSEARPADISAQAAWMQKWGWIPKFHGSEYPASSSGSGSNGASAQFEPAGHVLTAEGTNGSSITIPATGLSLIYDPTDGYPYDPANIGGYLRTDLYGRPLPVTPKLPVSTGLLYSGQNTGQSLLQ